MIIDNLPFLLGVREATARYARRAFVSLVFMADAFNRQHAKGEDKCEVKGDVKGEDSSKDGDITMDKRKGRDDKRVKQLVGETTDAVVGVGVGVGYEGRDKGEGKGKDEYEGNLRADTGTGSVVVGSDDNADNMDGDGDRDSDSDSGESESDSEGNAQKSRKRYKPAEIANMKGRRTPPSSSPRILQMRLTVHTSRRKSTGTASHSRRNDDSDHVAIVADYPE